MLGGLAIAKALFWDVFLGDLGIIVDFLGDLGAFGAFLEELSPSLLPRPKGLSGVRERGLGDGGQRFSGLFPSFSLDLLRLEGYRFADLTTASLLLEWSLPVFLCILRDRFTAAAASLVLE